ncbi:MAG: hypothetical protein SVR08_01870, partial [Spirochaetota bacterium]|nr:hypothetical protein [Spirochaetota bacterium]
DKYIYFLLSLSYFLANRFNDADSFIKKIKNIDPEYLPCFQLETFIILKSTNNINIVISRYIELIKKFPKDKTLKRSLFILHKIDDFNNFQKNARLYDFVSVPKPGRKVISHRKTKIFINKQIKISIIVFLVIAVSSATALSVYFILNRETERTPAKAISQIDMVNLDSSRYDLIYKIRKEKTPIFYFSNENLLKDFKSAKLLIKKNKFNNALKILNKLNNSNANYRVKEKIEFLRKFIIEIEDRNFEHVPFKDVSKNPYLYKGFNIRWKGRVTNIKKKKQKLTFSLLVDYVNNDIFTGIAEIYFDKSQCEIKNGDTVIVKAIFVNTIGSGNRIYLIAKDIRKVM